MRIITHTLIPGSINNKGIELAVTYRNNSHDLKWSISGNVTTIKNRVLSVGDQGGANYIVQNPDFTRAQIGHPIGSWFVLKDIGIFQNQAEIDNYKRANGDLIEPFAKPGDISFMLARMEQDLLVITTVFLTEQHCLIYKTGLQFNASYKQFSINLQLVGVFGSTLFDAVRQTLDSYQILISVLASAHGRPLMPILPIRA